MEQESAQFLLSANGRDILSFIESLSKEPLETGKILRNRYPSVKPSHLSAAVELSVARKKGITKFSRAGEMFFTRETLEQSTGEGIASHCAERFSGIDRTLDACCGIGGDSIALGKVVNSLTCMDISPVHLAFCKENLRIRGIEAEMVEADITEMKDSLSGYIAVFMDPSRRIDSKRSFDPSKMSPPLSEVIDILGKVPCGAAKLPTSINSYDISIPHELEWISNADGLKEAVMWTGGFARCRTSVTLLHENVSLNDIMLSGGEPEINKAGGYLYEPDPALIRSGLLGRKAVSAGLWLINDKIAYMSSDKYVQDPFFTAYRILKCLDFNLKVIERELRDMDAGILTVKKRGFPMLPEEIAGKIKLDGKKAVTIVATKELGKSKVFIVERLN